MSSSSCCAGGGGPTKGFCPFSLLLFTATLSAFVHRRRIGEGSAKDRAGEDETEKMEGGGGPKEEDCAGKEGAAPFGDPYTVVFVLGGPGAGKGTQCELLRKNLGWSHLSAGDLLRAERSSGSELAGVINAKISAGQLVPSDITATLIKNAMERERSDSGGTRFLIDGFPRSEGNCSAWDEIFSDGSASVRMVLFLDCPEETMTGRLLERAKTSGRTDDSLDVIRKRFETFRRESMPVVERYEGEGKVKKVRADRSIKDVYADVSALLGEL